MTWRWLALPISVCGLATCQQQHVGATIPKGYPSSYADEIESARTEGELDIWSAIDKQKSAALVRAFSRRYPGINVHYVEMPARTLYQRFLQAAASGKGTVDFLWSSAMDLQIKLVNDGYTQRYVSPERYAVPHWANWKNQAWGTTAEPVVFLYNKRLIKPQDVPKGHVALMTSLTDHPGSLRGKVATYDLNRSAVGYLYLSQDAQASHDIWGLIRAMGLSRQTTFANAESVVRAVEKGRAALAYDIVGSYALGQVEKNPVIGMVVPRDYTLLMSRIAVIPAAARHPNAGKLFLDFLLSRRGQAFLASENMPPIRSDVAGPAALEAPGIALRGIRVGPSLLVTQDQLTRRYMLKRWNAAVALPNLAAEEGQSTSSAAESHSAGAKSAS